MAVPKDKVDHRDENGREREIDRFVAIATENGQTYLIGGDPDDIMVRQFVVEHNRRYFAGEAGSPTGAPAQRCTGATRFKDWQEYNDMNASGEEIDLSDVLNKE